MFYHAKTSMSFSVRIKYAQEAKFKIVTFPCLRQKIQSKKDLTTRHKKMKNVFDYKIACNALF